MHFAWWSGTLLLALVNSSILMFCVTPSPLNLEGLFIHVVAIHVCLHSGKEEIISLDQIQVEKGLVFKYFDVYFVKLAVKSSCLLISAEDRGC